MSPGAQDRLGPIRLAIGAVSAFLLVSFGAQIIAAPLTLPALWWATRTARTVAARLALTVVASLTMLFVGWGFAYWIAGENPVGMIAGPLLGAAAAVVLFGRTAWLSDTAE